VPTSAFSALRAAGLAAAAVLAAAAAPAAEGPAATAADLNQGLLRAMHAPASAGFAGRRAILAPVIRRDLDLPLMTRLVAGPLWRRLKPGERHDLLAAFADYSIAVYASRFDGYDGERFTVDPRTTALADGDVIVRTQLAPRSGDPVELDYLMRRDGGAWRIVDVFLSGTISQLAAQRSEYASILESGGAPALARLLSRKAAELSR
jgi:phospholipid transport system substrate-binding protein